MCLVCFQLRVTTLNYDMCILYKKKLCTYTYVDT